MAQTVFDKEFGEIAVKRIATSRSVRLRVRADGTLHATVPLFGGLRVVSKLLNENREKLREILEQHKTPTKMYKNGQTITAKHRLQFEYAEVEKPRVSVRTGVVRVALPPELSMDHPDAQEAAGRGIHKAVKAEAEIYLPKRLAELSEQTGIRYQSLSFNNAKGRWGSCSSNGQIRLNIALMKLPKSLSDYVMIHELCHILELNHSDGFWRHVRSHCPSVDSARKRLRDYSPYL